jgi:hypothetical protein
MGQSIILTKRDFLELSLEIDRNIALEMSTGFGGPNRPTTVTSLPLTIDELKDVIDQLTDLHKTLQESWTCKNCKAINRKEWTVCDTCEVAVLEPL